MLALVLGNRRRVRMSKARLCVFQGLRHARPELQPVDAAAHAPRFRWSAFGVRNARPAVIQLTAPGSIDCTEPMLSR